MSSKQAHEIYQKEFDSYRRESIYKSLEKLVSVGLLEKVYDEEKGLVYVAKNTKIQLNLEDKTVYAIQ